MEFAIFSTLSTLVGLFIGFHFSKHLYLQKIESSNLLTRDSPQRYATNNRLTYDRSGFDDLENRFLSALVNSENLYINVEELNQLLRLAKLSKESQRQRRHIFLKELNIKLSLHFNQRECVERISSELDGRTKLYKFNASISPEQIHNLIG
jgi:hypothetical protein